MMPCSRSSSAKPSSHFARRGAAVGARVAKEILVVAAERRLGGRQ